MQRCLLLGVHRPRVDIEVGVDLDRGDVHSLSVQPARGIAVLALILRPSVLSSSPVEEAVEHNVSVCTCKALLLHRVDSLPMMPYISALVLPSQLQFLRSYLPHAADHTT